MNNTVIPIVLTSDENYAPYMYVTILSILKNKKNSTVYDIYILIDKIFSKRTMHKFNQLEQKYKTKFNYVEMGDKYSSIEMKINHITTPTYYRLSIPELLKKYNKAIYLDTDVIVLKDLSEYFNINVSEYYIAGVRAAAYQLNDSNKEYYNNIGLKDMSNYINAGVTLWNLDKIRNTPYKQQELHELTKKRLKSQDQDVINIAFKDQIKILSPKYNLMTKYPDLAEKSDKIYKKYSEIWDKKQIDEAVDAPVIIHYANPEKPWNRKVWLDSYWWEYAKKSPFNFWFNKNIFSISKNSKRTIIKILGLKIKIKKRG